MRIVNGVVSDTKVFKLKRIKPSSIQIVLEKIHFQPGIDLSSNDETKSLTVKVWWGLGSHFSEERKTEGMAIVKDTMSEIKEIISGHDT